MDFEFLINKPNDEFELFMLVCKSIQKNWAAQKGKFQVLHLKSAGEKQMKIEKVVTFNDGYAAGDYYFDSYAAEPTICTRYDDDKSIGAMLIGQNYTAIFQLTPTKIIKDTYGEYSQIPHRKELYKTMSAQEVRRAFHGIGDELARKKAM